jgi:hypothetical protein
MATTKGKAKAKPDPVEDVDSQVDREFAARPRNRQLAVLFARRMLAETFPMYRAARIVVEFDGLPNVVVPLDESQAEDVEDPDGGD